MRSLPFLFVVALLPATVGAAPPCGQCHPVQASAWQASLHARATEDPLYLAMREWARQDGGEQVAALCVSCHSVAVQGSEARTPSVTCEVCHQGASTGPGPMGWVVDPARAIRASTDTGKAPHPVEVTEELASGEVCMACHAELHNPRGVPLCTTGPESERRSGGASCVTCHLPAGDHAVPGTTREILGRAVELNIQVVAGEVRVTVLNRGAGHALPTGSALRQVVLETRFSNPQGLVLASHREVFARVLEDAEGKAPAPPWRAAAVHSDTRLMPQERRSLSYPVPEEASRVEARLSYHRAPPPLAAKLGVAELPFMAPLEIARFERSLSR